MSRRRPVAALILLSGLAFYIVIAMALHNILPVHWAVDLIYFPLAGVLWVPPALRVFRWGQAG